MRELTNFEINWIEKKLDAYAEHLMEEMKEHESSRLEDYESTHSGYSAEDLEAVKDEIHKAAEQERQNLIQKYRKELEEDCYASGEDDGSHLCYDGQIIRDHDAEEAAV